MGWNSSQRDGDVRGDAAYRQDRFLEREKKTYRQNAGQKYNAGSSAQQSKFFFSAFT